MSSSEQSASGTPRPGAEQIWAVYPDALVVVGVKERNGGKTVTLQRSDGSRREEVVSRFTYINYKPDGSGEPALGTADFVRIADSLQGCSLVKLCDDGGGKLVQAVIRPYYQRDCNVVLTEGVSYRLRCQEVTTKDEFAAVSWLNRFHYRSLSLWGRSSAIIARVLHGENDSPGYVGYIMLNSAPLLTRPRDKLMGWNKTGRLDNVDRIVRIARVVVHPEFRGLGIGRILVEAAIQYAETHWNAMGKKPWVLETVAEMSKYHPVFLRGGMFQFGTTAGRDDVFLKPAAELDHEMGAGHWRSSLDRMKMVASTPKPYFAAVLSSCPPRVRSGISERKGTMDSTSVSPANSEHQRLQPPLVRFLRVTLTYNSSGAVIPHDERIAGNSAMVEDTSSNSFDISEAVPVLTRILSVVDQIRADRDLNCLGNRCGRPELPALRASWRKLQSRLRVCAADLGKNINESSRLSETMRQLDFELSQLVSKATVKCGTVATAADDLLGELDRSIEQIVVSGATDKALWRDMSAYRNRIADFVRLINAPAATSRQKEIASAFGITLDGRSQVVLEDFSLDVLPGQVVLLVGASGSGKTSLLRAIIDDALVSAGVLNSPDLEGKVGILDLDFPADVPVIDLVGADTVEACRILNAAGISEAKLYLKRRHELSHGQRYRVAAAILAASGKSVWLADEFCAFLDPTTAAIVSSGMSRLARELGATFVASVADGSRVASALRPDVTVRLVYGGRPCPDVRLRYWKSIDEWCQQAAEDKSGGPLHAYTNSRDIIYHRMTTEFTICPSAQEESVAGNLHESLRDLVPEWTDTTLKRQIRLRLRLRRCLMTAGSAGNQGEEPS